MYQSSGLEKTEIGATPARTNPIGYNQKKKEERKAYMYQKVKEMNG